MSNRDGLREHFQVNLINADATKIMTIYGFEMNTADASRNFRDRIRNTDWKFLVRTMTNNTNGRTLKIIGVRDSEVFSGTFPPAVPTKADSTL